MKRRAKEEPVRAAWALVFELGRGIKARMEATFGKRGLSFQQGLLLHHLGEGGPRQMSDFAVLLDCDASNVTGLVDRLEDRGLLARRASEEDRRVKLLVLTPEGQRLRAKLLDELMTPPARLRELSAADQRALRDLLARTLELMRD